MIVKWNSDLKVEKRIYACYIMTNRKAFEDTLIKLTVIVKLNVKIIK